MSNLIQKHQIKTIHPIATLFLNQYSVLIFMFAIILLSGGIPQVSPKFYLLMFCSSVLDLIAFISVSWAIKNAPISLLSPLSSFTPVFATFFGAVFLHEIPTFLKLMGIFTIVCGVYLLNITDSKEGIFKPLQKLISQKGVKLYFFTMMIWGITPIFQKQAIFETHPTKPLFASFFGFFLIMLYLSFYSIKKVKQQEVTIKKYAWFFVLFGFLEALNQLAAYTVFSLTQVGYATAIFSLSSLFVIVFGGVLFKETRIKERLIGASVMILGTVLLTL